MSAIIVQRRAAYVRLCRIEGLPTVIWQSRSATLYEPYLNVIAAWKEGINERIG
jgi:hypothetical protein